LQKPFCKGELLSGIPNYGKPLTIQSDHETQFYNARWIKHLEDNEITAIFSAIRRPQSNLAERENKEINRCLSTYCHANQRNWARYIPIINEFFNNVTHDKSGNTPNEIQLNQKNTRFWSDIVNMPELKEKPQEISVKLQKIILIRNKLIVQINLIKK
jgi:transposase InsO family protein